MGKGDNVRPVDKEKFDKGFESVFGKHPGLKQWNPEEDDEVSEETEGASGQPRKVSTAVPKVLGVEPRNRGEASHFQAGD